MTKQAVIYLLVLLVGLAGGTGVGYLLTQSKLDDANAAADKLNTDIEDLTAQSEKELKTANAKVSRLETELTKSRNEMMRKNTELQRAEANVERMKTLLQQTLQQTKQSISAPSTASKPAATRPTTVTSPGTARTTTHPTTVAGTREYTIKSGDSLWKIAATELGNGTRWEEIDELNPDIDQNSTLKVGTKIKIPAR